ncbi:MAG: EamA family transporter, partial [Luteimonas sp.]
MSTARGLGGRDLLLVLIICIAWAANFLTSAFALREIPPFLFTAVRLAILALLLGAFVKPPAPGQWPRLIAVALCNGVLHFGLSFWALQLAGNLSSPAIVMQSYVPMAALLAWWWLGERFGWRTGLAIALSFAGVLVLGFDPMVFARPASLLLMLVSALFLA